MLASEVVVAAGSEHRSIDQLPTDRLTTVHLGLTDRENLLLVSVSGVAKSAIGNETVPARREELLQWQQKVVGGRWFLLKAISF